MSDELFQLAVSLIRRGTGYVDLMSELEKAARTPMDVRDIISEAGKFVTEMQARALGANLQLGITQSRWHPLPTRFTTSPRRAKS